MVSAGFWRGQKLGPYTLFRADQARDAYQAKDVFDNGWGHFRLLGPRAGAPSNVHGIKSAFRLGPIYNYWQYLGVFFLGRVTPFSLVIVDWFLSLLSIALFYFFIRNFFKQKISLLVTTIFAFSYFLTLYSRFSWNINQVIFWELLVVQGLLQIVKTDYRERVFLKIPFLKKEFSLQKRNGWFLLVVFALTVISQLHILAAVAFAFVFGMTILIYRSRIKWSVWITGFLVVIFLYSPMIISDVYNKGDNLQRLIKAGQLEKRENKSFVKKIKKLNGYYGKEATLILSGFNRHTYKKITLVGEWFVFLSLVLIISFFVVDKFLNSKFSGQKNELPEGWWRRFQSLFLLSQEQKRFLLVVLLWFFIFLLLYFRILPRLHKGRYWLLIAPLFFVMLGLWFYLLDKISREYLSGWKKIIPQVAIVGIAGFLFFGNLTTGTIFYKSLEKGAVINNRIHHRITLGPFGFLTTYQEMKSIVDYLAKESVRHQDSRGICFRSVEYQHRLGFEYLFDFYYSEIKYRETASPAEYDCSFYLITKTSRKDRELEDFLALYQPKKKKIFKSLTVWEMKERKTVPRGKPLPIKEHYYEDDGRAIFWKDVFSGKGLINFN